MKLSLKFFLVLSTILFLFSSCAKKNDMGKMIPGNALFVAQINMKSLDSKLSWNEIKQTNWYKKTYSDPSTPEWRKQILDNPSASGINFDEGLIFFTAKDTSGYYLAAEGKLKSEKDFEKFNKSFDPAQVIKKEGDISLLILKDKNVVGWDDQHFIYLMNPSTTSSQIYNRNGASNIQFDSMPTDRSTELSALCKRLFSLNSNASLEKNDKFTALLKEPGDIHVWQNTEEIIKSAPSLGMLSMLKLDAFTKDNVSTYTATFYNGRIDINQKGYVSKELADVLRKYTGDNINKSMIESIPSQNVIGVLAFKFKPEGIKELIKLTGADGLLNTYGQQMGFNLDDISKATDGNWLLAFSDFKMNQGSFNYKDDKENDITAGKFNNPDFNYIFSTGIGDKASLQKIINAVSKIGSQMGKDSMIKNYAMNDKTFAIGSSSSFVSQYLAGNTNKNDFTDKISGHPLGFFLDIHKILSELSSTPLNGSNEKAIMEQSLKTWNNIIATGGDFKDNAFTFHTEINFVDQNTNSLKQLNNYINEMYRINESEKEQNDNRLDSLLTPPPIDTVKVK